MPSDVLQRDLRSVQNVASASAAQAAHAEANQDELQQLQVCRPRAVCTSIHVFLCVCVCVCVYVCVCVCFITVMAMLVSRSHAPQLLAATPTRPHLLYLSLHSIALPNKCTKLISVLNCHVWLADVSHSLSSGMLLQRQLYFDVLVAAYQH